MSPHVRKNDAGVATDNSRIGHVEKLAGDHDAVPTGLGFHLNVDLKWVRAIEHLPRPSTCGSSSFEYRLEQAVEENLDAAAGSRFSSTVFSDRYSKELDPQVLGRGRCSIARTHFRSTFKWKPSPVGTASWSPASFST